MAFRVPRSLRIAGLLSSAFVLGGSSAEVALRTHSAIERARAEREIGSSGQLVELAVTDGEGHVVARPRIIAPVGKASELVLHDPTDPERIRLWLRVEAELQPTGEIALDYTLKIPGRDLHTTGKLRLTPGVQETVDVSKDGAILATWFALPVPSAAFDAYIEAQTNPPRASNS